MPNGGKTQTLGNLYSEAFRSCHSILFEERNSLLFCMSHDSLFPYVLEGVLGILQPQNSLLEMDKSSFVSDLHSRVSQMMLGGV